MTDRQYHPLSGIVPLLGGEDFTAFDANIRDNGLLEPIVLHPDGSILDGRNRYRACIEAGVEPRFRTFGDRASDGDDPRAFVISLNIIRRHLDESQRAIAAARIANLDEGRPSKTTEISAVSQGQAAKLLNVSPDSVGFARKVLESGDAEIAGFVDSGKLTVSRAAGLLKQSPELVTEVKAGLTAGLKPMEALKQARKKLLPETVAVLPNGVFRVILADPPWQYGDNRQGEGYAGTGAVHHYATMTLDELMALKVRDIAAPDSVLLMWATFPMLREALQLIEAWGFAYKQAFVWDKGHGSLGHYHDCDAELLTISVRGSCLPDSVKRPKQIQRFAREGHSRKPFAWRDLIDAHWPLGPRVELFYRGEPIEGWETWGAEAPARSAPQRSGEGAPK
jgi:N6-adenosine-specific RNA methylase IME4/ParB-like chromosome segregation protein Spo0J